MSHGVIPLPPGSQMCWIKQNASDNRYLITRIKKNYQPISNFQRLSCFCQLRGLVKMAQLNLYQLSWCKSFFLTWSLKWCHLIPIFFVLGQNWLVVVRTIHEALSSKTSDCSREVVIIWESFSSSWMWIRPALVIFCMRICIGRSSLIAVLSARYSASIVESAIAVWSLDATFLQNQCQCTYPIWWVR